MIDLEPLPINLPCFRDAPVKLTPRPSFPSGPLLTMKLSSYKHRFEHHYHVRILTPFKCSQLLKSYLEDEQNLHGNKPPTGAIKCSLSNHCRSPRDASRRRCGLISNNLSYLYIRPTFIAPRDSWRRRDPCGQRDPLSTARSVNLRAVPKALPSAAAF